MMSMMQIRSSISLKWELFNDIDLGSTERKPLDLCNCNIIFCLQEKEKRKMKPEVFSVSYSTASAKMSSIKLYA